MRAAAGVGIERITIADAGDRKNELPTGEPGSLEWSVVTPSC